MGLDHRADATLGPTVRTEAPESRSTVRRVEEDERTHDQAPFDLRMACTVLKRSADSDSTDSNGSRKAGALARIAAGGSPSTTRATAMQRPPSSTSPSSTAKRRARTSARTAR